jgi:hypothetical protein
MIRYASSLSQHIAVFNRNQFYRLVSQQRSRWYAKGYNFWDHCISMPYCHLAQAKSIRKIRRGIVCCLGKLKHLKMKDAPNKSLLSYANAHRPGGCSEISFQRPFPCPGAQPQGSTNSGSEISCFSWIARAHIPLSVPILLGDVPLY